MKLRKLIRHRMEYLALALITFLVRLFPLTACLSAARSIGRLIYYLDRRHCRRGMDNLQRAFPERSAQECRAILKQVYINMAKVYMEFAHIPKMSGSYLKSHFCFADEKKLKALLKKGKGIVSISGHIGNWELLGSFLNRSGYALDALYRPMRNPLSDSYINRIREQGGMTLIPMKNSLRQCLRSLKDNHMLGLIADQDAGRHGVFVDFFKRPASTAQGPAFFALKTGSPMAFFALIRDKCDHHTLYMSDEFRIQRTGDEAKDLVRITRLWSDELEKWVRKYPEQWFWIHRKWHARPKK